MGRTNKHTIELNEKQNRIKQNKTKQNSME